MPSLHDFRSNFRFGRVKGGLRVRQDTKAYPASVRDAENMMVLADGTIRRRWGTEYKFDAGGLARIEPWAINNARQYLVLFLDGEMRVREPDGSVISTRSRPWDSTSLWFVDFVTYGETILTLDGTNVPVELTVPEVGVTAQTDWTPEKTQDLTRLKAPFRVFDEDLSFDLTIYTSEGAATSIGTHLVTATGKAAGNLAAGTGTVTSNKSFFTADHVGQRFRLLDGEIEITAVTNGTTADVKVYRDVAKKLEVNPFWVRKGSNRVEVAYFNHQLKRGDEVFIAGLSTETSDEMSSLLTGAPVHDGAPSGTAATYTVERIVDADHFEIIANVNATNDALLGGSDVLCFRVDPIFQVKEQVFSETRGWPQTAAFHEGRLWLASTASVPDGMWASAPNDLYNFDPGEGGPADAIQLYGVGDGGRIVNLVSQQDLIVMTEDGEFFVPGNPENPVWQENIRVLSSGTKHGAAYTTARVFDGGVFFVDETGKRLREMRPNSTGGYSADDVSIPISDWVKNPRDSTLYPGSGSEAMPYAIWCNETGGRLLVLHASRSDDSFGWMSWVLEGENKFCSVATLGGDLYACALIGGTYEILRFVDDDTLPELDAMRVETADPPISSGWTLPWTDQPVSYVFDGTYGGEAAAGAPILLDAPAAELVTGINMPFLMEMSPPRAASGQGPKAGKMQRLVSAEVHWMTTTIGTIAGEEVLDATDYEFLGPAIPVDEWREYHIGEWGREVALLMEDDKPGFFGMRAITMNVYF